MFCYNNKSEDSLLGFSFTHLHLKLCDTCVILAEGKFNRLLFT